MPSCRVVSVGADRVRVDDAKSRAVGLAFVVIISFHSREFGWEDERGIRLCASILVKFKISKWKFLCLPRKFEAVFRLIRRCFACLLACMQMEEDEEEDS